MDKKTESSFQLNKLPKNTFEITASVSAKDISAEEEKILLNERKSFEAKGFRKGMAPVKLVKESLGKEKLIRLILEKILPVVFQKAVEELKIKPIISPRVELVSAEEGKDWTVKFISCEEPEIDLNDYKDKIKNALKTEKIWTPKDKDDIKQEPGKEDKINAVLSWIIKNIKIEISDLLIEDELNRKLSNLLAQTEKLGLSIEQFLESQGKTLEELKSEYERQTIESLGFEFILGKIAEEEKIVVSDEDLNQALANAKNEEEKKALESQKYYLSVLIRRQKTLDFLSGLV